MASKILAFMQANIGKNFGDYTPPFSKFLNGIIVSAEEGKIVMEFEVHDTMLNPAGLMHGGVHAAIIDEMTGLMVATLGEPTLYVSSSLYVDFFGKVRHGEKVQATATLNKRGRTIMNAECFITNGEGKVVSKGTCNLVNTGIAI
ncbi:MAG: PaaI family thioesterase [Flavobacteriales bacterium]|nr:PaaI family thioesterase [Flavobacteriales bacterium]